MLHCSPRVSYRTRPLLFTTIQPFFSPVVPTVQSGGGVHRRKSLNGIYGIYANREGGGVGMGVGMGMGVGVVVGGEHGRARLLVVAG